MRIVVRLKMKRKSNGNARKVAVKRIIGDIIEISAGSAIFNF